MDRVHNLWLELAVETGLVGLSLCVVMMIFGGNAVLQVVDCLKDSEAKMMLLGCVAALFGYVIYQVVNPSDLGTVMIFGWLIGIVLGLSFPQADADLSSNSLVLEINHARIILQVLFLFTAIGTVYGFWHWVI